MLALDPGLERQRTRGSKDQQHHRILYNILAACSHWPGDWERLQDCELRQLSQEHRRAYIGDRMRQDCLQNIQGTVIQAITASPAASRLKYLEGPEQTCDYFQSPPMFQYAAAVGEGNFSQKGYRSEP